jgi:glycosyltransferase involved in cell wall biosynthesis
LKKICFFTSSGWENIDKEQYTLNDINILKTLGFDVIIATSFSEIPWNVDLYFSWWTSGSILPLFVAKLRGKPIIVVAGGNEAMLYRDSISKAPQGYIDTPWYKKLATRLTIRFSDQVICVSDYMISDVKKLGGNSLVTIHNCVNTEKYIFTSEPKEFITSIFKLDKSVIQLKRGVNLLKAFKLVLDEYPNEKLVIIGAKSNGYNNLKLLCNELGIAESVNFLGFLNNDLTVDWIRKSKIYVQPSDTETFGLAIAEAMSCQVPVVVSKKGAIPEVVGRDGVYVDHNDEVSIAKGMLEILTLSDEERRIIGDKLRNRVVEHFSIALRSKKIKKIIEEYI